MKRARRRVPPWFAWAELGSVLLAASIWYFLPNVGPWPLVLPLSCWIGRLVWTRRLTRRTPFDLLLVLFLLTAVIGVWASYNRQIAWAKFWLILSGILLFYAVVNAHSSVQETGVWIAVVLGVGIAFFFLATHDWTEFPVKFAALNSIGQSLQTLLPPIPGPRLNPNEAGGLLALLLPFAILGAFEIWTRFRTGAIHQRANRGIALVLILAALALMLFGLVMSASRGAWLALGAATLVALVWVGSARLRQPSVGPKQRLFLGLCTFILVAALGAFTLWQLGAFAEQSSLFSLDTWRNRRVFQTRSLTLVRDYALIGSGLGGFQMLYSTYVMLLHVGFISDSHNLFLGVAIDQGLPALVSLIAMWALFVVMALRIRRRGRLAAKEIDAELSPVGAATLSLVVMLVHGMAESALYGAGVVLLFFPLAFAVPASTEPHRKDMRLGTIALLLCLGMGLGMVLFQPQRTLATLYSNLGSIHQSQAELSIYKWPDWVIQDEVRNSVDLHQAMVDFARALAWNPQNATANRRLAMIDLSQGRYRDALHRLELAYVAEPASMTTRQLLGEALIVNGRVKEGQEQWADVSNAQGQLQIRAFWYEYIGDAERAAWIRQAADRP